MMAGKGSARINQVSQGEELTLNHLVLLKQRIRLLKVSNVLMRSGKTPDCRLVEKEPRPLSKGFFWQGLKPLGEVSLPSHL